MTPLDVLKGARELLSDEKRWTKGHLAMNEAGQPLNNLKEDYPVCFCSIGAILHIAGGWGGSKP